MISLQRGTVELSPPKRRQLYCQHISRPTGRHGHRLSWRHHQRDHQLRPVRHDQMSGSPIDPRPDGSSTSPISFHRLHRQYQNTPIGDRQFPEFVGPVGSTLTRPSLIDIRDRAAEHPRSAAADGIDRRHRADGDHVGMNTVGCTPGELPNLPEACETARPVRMRSAPRRRCDARPETLARRLTGATIPGRNRVTTFPGEWQNGRHR